MTDKVSVQASMPSHIPPQRVDRMIPVATHQLATYNQRLLALIEQLEEVNARAFSSPSSFSNETDGVDTGISLESLSSEIAMYNSLLDRLSGTVEQTEKII